MKTSLISKVLNRLNGIGWDEARCEGYAADLGVDSLESPAEVVTAIQNADEATLMAFVSNNDF